jgi:hypothetical protein
MTAYLLFTLAALFAAAAAINHLNARLEPGEQTLVAVLGLFGLFFALAGLAFVA